MTFEQMSALTGVSPAVIRYLTRHGQIAGAEPIGGTIYNTTGLRLTPEVAVWLDCRLTPEMRAFVDCTPAPAPEPWDNWSR